MLVREIMTSPAFQVRGDASLEEALELMAERHVTSLPVVDEAGELVGILSEMDVLRHSLEPDPRAHVMPVASPTEDPPGTVREVMTPDPRTTVEGADVAELVELFATTSFKSLPVLREGALVGVVSRSDVIRALWRPDREVQAEVEALLAEYGRDRWQVATHHGVVTVTGPASSRDRDIATAIVRSVLGVRRVRHAEPA